MKSFLLKSSVLGAVLILSEFLIETVANKTVHIPLFPVLVIFFWAVTNIIHSFLLKATEKNVRRFNPVFLGLNMLKMFIYLILASVYLWFFREYAVHFAIGLFFLYASFSVLEIREISKIVKQKK